MQELVIRTKPHALLRMVHVGLSLMFTEDVTGSNRMNCEVHLVYAQIQ